jgi:small-conductance mechanosensitive channel
MEFLDVTYYGNTLRDWGIGALTAIVALLILRLIRVIVLSRLRSWAQKTETEWDDIITGMLSRTRALFLLIVAIYAGSLVLSLSTGIHEIIATVVMIALLIQGGIWLSAGIGLWLESYRRKQQADDAAAATTVTAIGFIVKLLVWSVVLLLALENLGVDITALVAGLGIGGIAVALAVQNILGDLFASLSIVLDKPFVLGDFLIIGDFMGSVEHIGLKTTRIRSLSGEQLIFSNTDLLGSRIRNYGRMFERRVLFTIGVTYQTPREKLARIPQMIRNTIEAQENTRFDRSHFKEYGDFSLNFETVYYVLVPEYNTYMDIQQAINLSIHEQFEVEGIEFAYPTQTLFIEKPEN